MSDVNTPQIEFIASRCICCDCSQLQRSPAVLMPFVAKRVFGHEPLEITGHWGLRDLKKGMAYTLCNSVQCQSCGVLFLDYRFTDQQMAALYRGYRDEEYTRQRNDYEPGYAEVAAHYQGREAYSADVERWLSRHVSAEPAVLDWGGGSGLNTPFLNRKNLVHVHDISTVEVVPGALRVGPDDIAGTDYDLVVCSQVLEHVSFPQVLIQELLPALGPHTLLYLEVPHEALMREYPDDLGLASRKRHWHEHINFFTRRGLHCLLERAGLTLLDSHCLPIDLGWRSGEIMGVLARRAANV